MSDAMLQARSVSEIQLYLRIAACAHCGKGPLSLRDPACLVDDRAPLTEICISCSACGESWSQGIELADRPTEATSLDEDSINPGMEPSRMIDLGQWLVLVSLLKEEARREPDKSHARKLGMTTARCVDEALKFYTDDENDLPPPEAFFDEMSRKRFRESPEQFSRERVADLKSGLPRPYTGH